MWQAIGAVLVIAGVLGGLVFLSSAFQRWSAAEEERRLPPLSVSPELIPLLTRQVFETVCILGDPETPVAMGRYFKEHGWNERDIREILRPISPSLITRKSPFFHIYLPTERGLNVYGGLIMSEPAEQFNIFAGGGSFVGGINIKSNGATAQAGHTNSSSTQFAGYQQVVDALRTDARSAGGIESEAAQNNADDLEEAIAAQDQPRIDRILGRVASLLASASSAFTLTREATNLIG